MPLSPDIIEKFANAYAAAWSSRSLDAVAAFFEDDCRAWVNDGEPVSGIAAQKRLIGDFLTAFPDLKIRMDGLRTAGTNAIFLWTLTGTFAGPGGTGKSVDLKGWEAWALSDKPRIRHSRGYFDADDYASQVAGAA